MTYSSDVAFTDSVKAVRTSEGSRRPMRAWKREARGRPASRPVLSYAGRSR